MREAAIITGKFCIRADFESKPRYGALTRFYTCPTGRRDKQASSRHKNSSANRAFGSQDHFEGYVHPQSPLRHDGMGEDSEATTRRLGSEKDNRHQAERETREWGPAEHQRGTVGADPVGRVVEGPDVGEEPAPSQEPVLDGAGTGRGELGRSLLGQVLGSWRQER